MNFLQQCLAYAYNSTYSKVLTGGSRNSTTTTHSTKLRPKDVLRVSPFGPLCNAKGRPLPTSWRAPHIVLYVTSRDVPYRRLENASCRRYDFTLSPDPLNSICNQFSHAWSRWKLLRTRFLFVSNTYISNTRLEQATLGWNWQKIKQILSKNLRLNFYYWKILFFIHVTIQKKIGYIPKNEQKNKCVCIQLFIIQLFISVFSYTINHNENEDETEKQIT